MPSDYEKLTDRELDALIAERAMRLTVIKPPFIPSEVHRSPLVVFSDIAQEIWRATYRSGDHVAGIAHYSTDDNAVRLVRDRIAELNLRTKFEEALYGMVGPGDFNLIHSTHRQQCIAALFALDTRETEGERT